VVDALPSAHTRNCSAESIMVSYTSKPSDSKSCGETQLEYVDGSDCGITTPASNARKIILIYERLC
jgi:hypothetical protein